MKTLPSLRISSLVLLGLLGTSLAFALQAQTSSSGGGSGSATGSGPVSGSGGTTPAQPGTPTQPAQPAQPVQPGTPDQPGLPIQPGTPDQPGLPRQPGVPDQPGLPRQPGLPDQPGLPRQPGLPDPALPPNPSVVGGTGTDTAVGINADGTRTDGAAVAETGLDARATTQKLRGTGFTMRDQALRDVERSSTLGAGYIGMIERNTAPVTGEGRTKVNNAVRRANAARIELDKAISLARSANASRWEDARADLVERYNAYDQALEEARAAAIEARVGTHTGTSASGGM